MQGDLLRKANTGVRGAASSPEKAMMPAVCLEIASKQCRRPLSRDDLLEHAGLKTRDYFRALVSTPAQALRRGV